MDGVDNLSPPADVELRKIIETLAQYVAKNGTNFEDMVKKREINNPQFYFLRGGEFNRYYEHCVAAERIKLFPQAAPLPVHGQQPSAAGNPPAAPVAPVQSAVQRAAAIAASLVQQQQQQAQQQAQQHAPSVSGAYHQQNAFGQFGDPSGNQNYARQPFNYGPPPGQPPLPPRFAPPNWQPAPNQVDYSQMPPNQPGFPLGFPQGPPPRSRFSQGVPPPPQFAVNHQLRPGPPPNFTPAGMNNVPLPGMGFHPAFGPPPGMPQQFQPPPLYSDPPPAVEPPPPDPRPWYDLPAGVMLSLIRTEDTEYKSLDPKALTIPPPQPITEKILRAVDEFYSHPNSGQPRNAEGWEKLGLYDFYKAKDAAKKALQRGETVRQYKPGRSRSPSPESRYSSRSRSRSRSRSCSNSRSRSRSRSSSRRRSVSPSTKSHRRSRSRS